MKGKGDLRMERKDNGENEMLKSRRTGKARGEKKKQKKRLI